MSLRPIAVTCREGFAGRGRAALMSVNAGAPVVEALERASCILGTIADLAMNIGDDGLRGSEIFAVQYLTEMAKALVDAAVMGTTQVEVADAQSPRQ